MTLARDLSDRFWRKVDVGGPEECWPWTGTLFRGGHGCFKVGRANRPAHRVAAELAGLTIEGLVVHHTCEVKHCVNPGHFELMTHEAHTRLHSAKSQCDRGHSPERYVRRGRQNVCLDCRNEVNRRYRQRKNQ
jgi:hypothetical protein